MEPFGIADIYHKKPRQEEFDSLAKMAGSAGKYLMNNLSGAEYRGQAPRDAWTNRNNPNFEPSIFAKPQMLESTFGGAKARTAALDMLFKAKDMVGRGVGANLVKKATGWFKGMEGKWKFEIDDSVLKTKIQPKDRMMNIAYRLSDVMDHPQLFKAYPDIKNVGVIYTTGKKGAKFSPTKNEIEVGKNSNPKDIIHEIQHKLQEVENFARGGNPNQFRSMASSDEKVAAYQRLAGEIEARDAANRLGLSAYQRMETPPVIKQNSIVNFQ